MYVFILKEKSLLEKNFVGTLATTLTADRHGPLKISIPTVCYTTVQSKCHSDLIPMSSEINLQSLTTIII